uniref:Copper transport protein n=1 Tax=Anolis carolinensis TaxID=28377 RepID=A0A803TVB8_ANOCA
MKHNKMNDCLILSQLTLLVVVLLTGMVLTVVVILLLAVLYEAIKAGKLKLIQCAMPVVPPSISQEAAQFLPEGATVGSIRFSFVKRCPFPWHVVQTLIHVVQVVLGYMVMLAVMSYNSWVFIGVIVGSAIGYYVTYPLISVR